VHRVVIADDNEATRELVRESLAHNSDIKIVGEARNGRDAVMVAESTRPDVVVMDVDMPYLDGAHATEQILISNPSTRVLAFTGHTDADAITRMMVAGAVGYVVKGATPGDLAQAVIDAARRSAHIDPAAISGLCDSLVEMARSERERRREVEEMAHSLEWMFDNTIRALVGALHQRDGYTGDHDDRVASYCVAVGEQFGMAGNELKDLRYGGIFHDIGKIGVPDHILHKTCELDDDEWAIIKQHTLIGERILQPIEELRKAGTIVRHSHEHWDGSGYPDRLIGIDIPLGSRIVFACDAYDAITTDRTYQKGRPPDIAFKIMQELKNVHFDPEVVDALATTLHA
jgi:response regulator RpfG family c-di-GMP phosphodiesterase